MLFRRKINRACMYCLYSALTEDEKIICAKRGEVSADSRCLRFRYDPCKRIPPKMKALDTKKFEDTDFSL